MNTSIKSALKSRALHISLLFLFAGAVFSCVKEVLPDSQQDNTEAQGVISVAQARTFFEQALVNNAARSTSGPGIKHGTLSPGDFTPLWNEATTSANDKIGAVEVPIISTYRYRSVHSHFRRGKATAHSVAATQKLLIIKSRTGETMGAFIMTVIPSDGSSASKFRHTGCRENFSGTVLYRSALRTVGLPSTVTMYRDGALTARVSTRSGDNRQQRIKTIASVVRSLNLMRSAVSLTRSDDGEEGDGCPDCGSTDCGGGCVCPICGESGCSGECDNCPICGEQGCNGECDNCPICGEQGCNGECEMCPICGEQNCNGKCQKCFNCGSTECDGTCDLICSECNLVPCQCGPNQEICDGCGNYPCSCYEPVPLYYYCYPCNRWNCSCGCKHGEDVADDPCGCKCNELKR